MTLLIIGILYRFLLSLRYSITFKNPDLLASGKPTLFLSNHLALVDPQILVSHMYRYRPVAPVITDEYTKIPGLRWFFKRIHAIPVSNLENGSRDTEVMNKIKKRVINNLNKGINILLYPSGRLSDSGSESIGNKRSAYEIVCSLSPEVRIVGVRISGLWGSRFSKARTGKTPSLLNAYSRSFLFALSHLFFFMPHRNVLVELNDITDDAKKYCSDNRQELNRYLENYFNNKS